MPDKVTPEHIMEVMRDADCLYTDLQVQGKLDDLAKIITTEHANDNPIIICVLTGGIIPMGHLLTRLDFPLQIDYIHATRYRGETQGGELEWKVEPRMALAGRTVLVLDDILDEGYTLAAIKDYCDSKGAKVTKTIAIVEKIHDRKHGIVADYTGLQIEDRYVFGYGMDYKNYLRNANGIFAVKGL